MGEAWGWNSKLAAFGGVQRWGQPPASLRAQVIILSPNLWILFGRCNQRQQDGAAPHDPHLDVVCAADGVQIDFLGVQGCKCSTARSNRVLCGHRKVLYLDK